MAGKWAFYRDGRERYARKRLLECGGLVNFRSAAITFSESEKKRAFHKPFKIIPFQTSWLHLSWMKIRRMRLAYNLTLYEELSENRFAAVNIFRSNGKSLRWIVLLFHYFSTSPRHKCGIYHTVGGASLLSVEVWVSCYLPPYHSSYQLVIIFKFVAANILLQRWPDKVTARWQIYLI
jgi:hypothetical protein